MGDVIEYKNHPDYLGEYRMNRRSRAHMPTTRQFTLHMKIMASRGKYELVVNPATGKNFTVEECAVNTVPNGKKYKIVEDSDIPTDRSFRDAWTVDESDLTDGTGTFTGVLAQ